MFTESYHIVTGVLLSTFYFLLPSPPYLSLFLFIFFFHSNTEEHKEPFLVSKRKCERNVVFESVGNLFVHLQQKWVKCESECVSKMCVFRDVSMQIFMCFSLFSIVNGCVGIIFESKISSIHITSHHITKSKLNHKQFPYFTLKLQQNDFGSRKII